ncbi:MAG TPA: aspartyl protease family protein [Vicinamibacterales bacterium]
MRTAKTIPLLVVLMTVATVGREAMPAVVPLSPWTGLLRSITVTVDGTAHPFIFDTGGGTTMITPEVAASVRCTPYGRNIGFRMSGEPVEFGYCDNVALRLGQVALTREPVGVFDLQSILPAGLPRADGVLSLRSFRDRPLTIALGAGRLTIETADSLAARVKRMRPLTIRIATGPSGAETTVYVAARVGGRRVWLLLDSGNGDAALVAPHVAAMAGLKGAEGDAVIEIDGVGPVQLRVRPQPIIYDGVLGASFMQDWILTFDLASARAWAAPTNRASRK